MRALEIGRTRRPRRATWVGEDHAIGTLVAAPAHTVGEHAPLAEISRLLLDEDVPAVAVVDPAAALCGVITPTDLLMATTEWTAADAMSSAIAVLASTPLDEVTELMAAEHAVLVVITDPAGHVTGLVTARQIARHRRG